MGTLMGARTSVQQEKGVSRPGACRDRGRESHRGSRTPGGEGPAGRAMGTGKMEDRVVEPRDLGAPDWQT
jgi:hypothetical protein